MWCVEQAKDLRALTATVVCTQLRWPRQPALQNRVQIHTHTKSIKRQGLVCEWCPLEVWLVPPTNSLSAMQQMQPIDVIQCAEQSTVQWCVGTITESINYWASAPNYAVHSVSLTGALGPASNSIRRTGRWVVFGGTLSNSWREFVFACSVCCCLLCSKL